MIVFTVYIFGRLSVFRYISTFALILLSHQSYVTAMVTNPISVELPRSLVDVVVHWNFPMHFWLKQCKHLSSNSQLLID